MNMSYTRNELTASLHRFIRGGWKVGHRFGKDNGELLRWTLAATLHPTNECPNLEIAILESGEWAAISIDGAVFDIESRNEYFPFFPLLEMEYETVYNLLLSEFERNLAEPKWINEFPFESIVIAALRGASKFWPDYALSWATRLPLSIELGNTLQEVATNGATRQQRVLARSILSSSPHQRKA